MNNFTGIIEGAAKIKLKPIDTIYIFFFKLVK